MGFEDFGANIFLPEFVLFVLGDCQCHICALLFICDVTVLFTLSNVRSPINKHLNLETGRKKLRRRDTLKSNLNTETDYTFNQ